MKRVSAGVLAATALLLTTAVSGLAAGGPGPGTCSNIVGGSGFYTDPNGDTPNQVLGSINTETASCRSVVYTMYVVTYDATGASTDLLSTHLRGDGRAFFSDGRDFVGSFTVSNVTAPYVCVYYTSTRGPTVYDTASYNHVPCPESFDPTQPSPPAGVMTPGNGPAGGTYD